MKKPDWLKKPSWAKVPRMRALTFAEKKSIIEYGLALLIVIFIGTWVVMAPIVTIWSLNALFSLEIPINLGTWFAVIWLVFLLKEAPFNASKNDKK